jgi:hypothetical protein
VNELTKENKLEFHKQRFFTLVNMAGKNLISAGREAIEIKKELPYGQFQDWCEPNLGVSYRQVHNWMVQAQKELDSPEEMKSISFLSVSAKTLFLSSPEEVKDKVIVKINSGEEGAKYE